MMPSLEDALPYFVWSVFLVLLLLLTQSVLGQTLRADGEAKIEVWAEDARCYQHTWSGSVDGTFEWGPFQATGYVTRRVWGACDAKIPASPINAEADRVQTMIHGGYAQVAIFSGVSLGLQVHRRKVHHIYRYKNREGRHDHFPGNWKIGVRAASGGSAPSWPDDGPQKPSLGYYDAFGGRLEYDPSWGKMSLFYVPFRWKTVTLPPSVLFFQGHATHSRFRFGIDAEMDIRQNVAVEAEIDYNVASLLWIGASGGVKPMPGWSANLPFYAATITIR